MDAVYFCGDQRIWQCYTVMTLFQLKIQKLIEILSVVYLVFLLPVGERKGTDYRHIPNVCLSPVLFQTEETCIKKKQEISLSSSNIQGQPDLQLL